MVLTMMALLRNNSQSNHRTGIGHNCLTMQYQKGDLRLPGDSSNDKLLTILISKLYLNQNVIPPTSTSHHGDSIKMTSSPLATADFIANEIEKLADLLRPEVIRAARAEEEGRKNLDRIEYALGTIGKALILTDYSVDEQKDLDKLEEFRELHGRK